MRLALSIIICVALNVMVVGAVYAQDAGTAETKALPSPEQTAKAAIQNEDDDEWGDDWDDNSWVDNEDANADVPEADLYSLERCIELAFANNHNIRAANWELISSEARENEAWWAWFPEIKVTSVLGPAPDYNPPDISNTKAFLEYDSDDWAFDGIIWGSEISLLAPLYTFGKLKHLKDMGKLGTQLGQQKKRSVEAKTVFDVKRTYYTLQFIERLIHAFDEGMQYMSASEKKLEELIKSGSDSVSEFDRYKFKVVRADLYSRIEEANRSREVLLRAMRTLLSLPENAPFHLPKRFLSRPELETKIPELDRLSEVMEAKRPEFSMLDLGLKLKEKEEARQKSYYFPDFFLTAKYKYVLSPEIDNIDNPFLSDPYNSNTVTGAIGLRYKFDIPLQYYRTKRKEAEVRRFEQQRLMARDAMGLEMEETWRGYKEHMSKLKHNQEGENAGRKWMVSAFVSYNIGLLKSSEMIEAIVAYFKTQVSFHESVYNVHIARAKLLSLMGPDTSRSIGEESDFGLSIPVANPAEKSAN